MPQPFDQSFKLLSDDHPRATLALCADIPLSANLTVEPLHRELNLTTLRVDNLYRCRDEHSEFLIHIEAVSSYKPLFLDRQFAYAHAIAAKYQAPCRSYLVLLTDQSPPRVPLSSPIPPPESAKNCVQVSESQRPDSRTIC